jgi:hypothetical protein
MKKLIRLIFFVKVMGIFMVFSAVEFVKSAEVDLNGDGKKENILLSDYISGHGLFKLNIGEFSISGKLENGRPDGFKIVNIDKNDKFQEVAVHTPGPSDDDEYLIYGFDGVSIKKMGHLYRWPTFFGNGIVHVKNWMGFWSKIDKYVLQKSTRTLKKVAQEFYYVGVEVFVKKSFPVYRTRKGEKQVAYLKPVSNILLLLCDPSSKKFFDHWYLIKSSTSLIGWAKLGSFRQKVEGLMWAD